MNIIFCDIYKRFTDACHAQIKLHPHLQEVYKFGVYFGDIRDLKKEKNAAYISPANSFGSMGGGIDEIYSRDMFPFINKVVMAKIAQLDTRVVLKKSFDKLHKNVEYPALPIGESIITSLTDYEGYETCYLVSAPTMVYPSSVKYTNNAEKAFLSSLKTVEQWNNNNEHQIETIICPGLATGIGGLSPEECAAQIFSALNFLQKS